MGWENSGEAFSVVFFYWPLSIWGCIGWCGQTAARSTEWDESLAGCQILLWWLGQAGDHLRANKRVSEWRGKPDLHLESPLWKSHQSGTGGWKSFGIRRVFCYLTQQGAATLFRRDCWRKPATSMWNSKPHLAAGGRDFSSSLSGLSYSVFHRLCHPLMFSLTDLLHWSSFTVHLHLGSIQDIPYQKMQLTTFILNLMRRRMMNCYKLSQN